MSRFFVSIFFAFATALAFWAASCIKMDFFLFDSKPASLDDYDFSSEELNGIPPDRITSELIPSQQPDEELHVIFVERDEAKLDPRIDPERRVTILFSHGNSGNMLSYWYRVGYFEDMGFNVLMYDYRGYGASSGETTEENVYEDVETAYDYLTAKSNVGDVFSVGYSMGGAPAIWLCSPRSGRQVTGCFTEAAFASVQKLIDDGTDYDFEQSWFVDVEFDNEARINSVFLPFLIMHGTKDPKVAFENGEILWSAVRDNNPLNVFYAVEGANHRNVPVPSYEGFEEPREYSHPDELPPGLASEFEVYKSRIADFVVLSLGTASNETDSK